jgi:membrane protease YdiL (CAAX protease family)
MTSDAFEKYSKDCPEEFKEKVTVTPGKLILGTIIFIAAISFLIVLPLSFFIGSFLTRNKYLTLFIFYSIFLFAIFIFSKEMGIDLYSSFKSLLKERDNTLKIFSKYMLVYVLIITFLVLLSLIVIIVLNNTGIIGSKECLNYLNNTLPKEYLSGINLPFFSETLFLFDVCVLAPVVEEIYFRRFLYVSLRKKFQMLPSIIIVSFLFAVLHSNIISAAIGGIYLTYAYEKHKNLTANILLHSVANLIIAIINGLLKWNL